MEITDQEIATFIGQYLWPLARISGLMFAMPVFGTRLIPARVRVVLALSLTVIVRPLLPELPPFEGFSLTTLILVAQQLLIGLGLGFSLQLFFQLFILSGQLVANKMGLGFAAMNDPASGVTVTVISQYYLLLVTLLFLTFDGHTTLVEILVHSFTTLPIGHGAWTSSNYYDIASLGSWMFSAGLVIALPVLTALLIVNLAFGAMSRSAPQMNVFAVGFPLTLVLGLLLMWFSLVSLLPNFKRFLEQSFSFAHHLIGA